MRWPALLPLSIVVCLAATTPAHALPGDLDKFFGSEGLMTTPIGYRDDRANAAVLQPDGRIVAGGGTLSQDATTFSFALVRYDPVGVPDPSFGTDGIVITPAPGSGEIMSLVLQPDGKIVGLGYTYDGSQYDQVLVRYDATGAPDPTFGVGGMVVSDIGPGRGFPRTLLLQPDGRLVTLGDEYGPGYGLAFALSRFEPDGSVDATFGTGGETITMMPSFENLGGGALRDDGRIVAAGQSGFKVTLAQYLTDGTLDPGFGTSGIVSSAVMESGNAVVVLGDGKLIVGGNVYNGANYDFALARFDADGGLDATFGTGGVTKTAVGTSDDFPAALALARNDKILLAGSSATSLFTSNFAVVRYDATGNPDPGFGVGGVVSTPFPIFNRSDLLALLVQPDSKIVGVGARGLGPPDFAIARWFGNDCGDGTLEAGEECDDGNVAAGDCCSPICRFDPSGTACGSDANACTTDTCDDAGTCAHLPITCALCETCDPDVGCQGAPRDDCFAPARTGKTSTLVLEEGAREAAHWRWRSSTAGTADFGDPLQTDDYAVCIYGGPSGALWLRSRAPAGGVCGTSACWRALGSRGAKYVSPAHTPDGIASLTVRSNGAGAADLRLNAGGASLGLPSLPSLALPVRVQLQRTGGRCWEASYSAPRVSTTGRFQAKAD